MTPFDWMIFAYVVVVGLCVGSFLNVVILRLPEGQSLVYPPSHDPATGDRLKWWENIPLVSWLALRGRSRYSGQRISIQYPMIELITGVLFGAMFMGYYHAMDWRPWFAAGGLAATWPVLIVHLVLLACLIGSTAVDFKLYIIPLQLPWTATIIALVILPTATAMGWVPGGWEGFHHVVPVAPLPGIGAAVGGAVGLAVAVGLLWIGYLPRSFDDPPPEEAPEGPPQAAEATPRGPRSAANAPHQADVPTASAAAHPSASTADPIDPEAFLAHPHPRREVLKELLFLSFPVVGLLVGIVIAGGLGPEAGRGIPATWRVLGGVVSGYLVGGGLVWITRIFGTLAFGKEAMGLGDVHLLAAIGAVIGGFDATLVFFIAPFMGLAAALVMSLIAAMSKERVRVIPYGPYLAAAAIVMMLGRGPIIDLLRQLGILART